jgi:glycosyltransferase involved in cell wall biosynthesis
VFGSQLITIFTPCFNEEDNVDALYERVRTVMEGLGKYRYNHLFIDNASSDGTIDKLRRLAAQDPRVKVILNTRNFGHIRSPYYGLLQAPGDAVILMASDLQDPPELIPDFVRQWEEGYRVVLGVKTQSHETPLMFLLRSAYYSLVGRLSDVKLVKNSTGFGLYDRRVIEEMRKFDDVYPYFRGLFAELGFKPALITYTQPKRVRGITKNNFYTLYDMAMLGITNHSKLPLRLATMLGFLTGALSFVAALAYLVYKIIYWNHFSVGIAPIVIGVFFFSSVQMVFLGIVGEYVGSIQTQVLHRPLVVERERINFDEAEEHDVSTTAGRSPPAQND